MSGDRGATAVGAWIAIGLGVGVAFGVALDNIGLGIAIGAANARDRVKPEE